jgi:hypothetical protein
MKLIYLTFLSLLFISAFAQKENSLSGVWKSSPSDSIIVYSFSGDPTYFTVRFMRGSSQAFHMNSGKDTLLLMNEDEPKKYFLVNSSTGEMRDQFRLSSSPTTETITFKKTGQQVSMNTRKKNWQGEFFDLSTDYYNAGLLYSPGHRPQLPFNISRDFIVKHKPDSVNIDIFTNPPYDYIEEPVKTTELVYYFDSYGNIQKLKEIAYRSGAIDWVSESKYIYANKNLGLLDHLIIPQDEYIYYENNWETDKRRIKKAPLHHIVNWEYNTKGQPAKQKIGKIEIIYTYNEKDQLEKMLIVSNITRTRKEETFQYFYNSKGIPIKIIRF